MSDLASLVIKVDSTSAKRATNELGGLNNASKRVEGSVDRMGASAKRASADFSGLARVLSAAAAAAAALKFTQTADQMTNLESRIRLTMQATEDYTAIQSKLNNIARGSVASLNDLGTLYARIAPSIQRLGGTQRESLGIVTALNAALRINGATTAETSSVITQFSQAMQSGILRGEEFNALNENASPLMDRLAKNLGKTRGELRAMAFDGQLTADVVANNILPSVAELEETAASMGVTATAAFQDLTDDVRIAVGQIDDMTGATDTLASVINEGAKEVRDFVQALQDGNLSEQQQTMIGIAGAVAGMATAYAAVRSAIILTTIAQTAFNVAVRSNPLIMGLSVVTAGIAAIYGYTQATDAAKSTTDKLTEAEKKLEKMQEGRNRRGKATAAQIAEQQTLVDTLREKSKTEAKAAAEAAKAAEEAAKTGSDYKRLVGTITEASKKGKEEVDKIGDAFTVIADKIAKLNMTDAESTMFDFAKLAPSEDEMARMSEMVTQLELLTQAKENAEFAMDAYAQAVEAANQTVADFLNLDVGADLAVGFDAASQSIGAFVNAFEAVIEQQEKYREAIIAAGDDKDKIEDINKKQAKAQIKQYGDIAGAAKGFFKEGSKGYKALQAAEQAFRAFQIAMTAKELAVKLQALITGTTADTAATAVKVANAGEESIASGIAAQAKALAAAPPPANFALLAAVTAALVGIGVAVSGGRGGSSAVDAGNLGTGTVLGDATAESKSIKNSIEALESAAGLENRISSAMLASLQNIEANIAGVTSILLRGGEPGSLAAGGINIGSKLTTVGSAVATVLDVFTLGLFKGITGLIGGLFGKVKTTIKGQGLFAGSQDLTSILAGGFNLQEYVDVQIKKSGLFGSSTKNRTRFAAADPELGIQFGLIISDMVRTVQSAAVPLGSTAENISAALADFTVNIGKINLKGLKSDEIQARLEAVFGSIGDQIARTAFATVTAYESVITTQSSIFQGLFGGAFDDAISGLPAIFSSLFSKTNQQIVRISVEQYNALSEEQRKAFKPVMSATTALDDFQKGGEGFLETVVRVASGVEQANTALDRLNLTAINYTSIIQKQGDVSAEIVRQSVLLADTSANVAGGFREIVQNAQGTGDELAELVLTLRDLQDQLISTGKSGNDLTTFMISAAGGLDRLTEGLDAYFEDFLTPAEQAEELMRRMGNEFARIGQLVPESTEDFRALVEGIDTSSEAGQRLYGQVIALAPAFSELQDALSEAGREIEDIESAITSAFNDIRRAVEQAESELKKAYQTEQNALQQTIRQFDQLEQSLSNFRREIAGLIATTTGGSLAFARAQFQQAANRARLGDTDAMGRLPELGRAFAAASGADSATQQDMLRDLAAIARATAEAEAVAGRQRSIAQQQLDALTELVDALVPVTDAVLTVQEAVDNLRTLQTFENKAISDATSAGFGALLQQNGQTLSAIEKGTAATNAINSGIAALISIQAKQEADRQASIAAQKAEIERQAKIDALNQKAKPLADTVLNAESIRAQSTSTLDKLTQDAISLAKRTEVAINAKAGARSAINDATFGVNESGLFDQQFEQVTALGKNKGNMAKRIRNFNTEFYKAGGIYDQILTEAESLSLAKSQIDPSKMKLDLIRQQIIALGGVPSFGTGGMHEGGWRMVGENGPELEYTGPSRIFNAGQTNSMLSNDELKDELSAMRAEMRQAMYAIAKNTGKTYEQLNRWDDGDRMNVRIDNELDDPALVRTVA